MSDEFFNLYSALNQNNEPDPEAPADEHTAAQTEHSADPAEDSAQPHSQHPEADAQPIAESPSPEASQQPAWRSAYYSAPSSESVNPYASSYGSYTAQPQRPMSESSYPSGDGTFVDADGYYHRSFTEHRTSPVQTAPPAMKREKKERAKISAGAVAIILIVCIIVSGFAGFGGSMLASKLNGGTDSASAYDTVSDELVIHKVSVETTAASEGELVDKGTDEITKSVADSVVEIVTEVVQTSSFYGQYVSQGAGSGVIISEDGYIITNNHVIEDASSITVTLRSGESYEATLVGTDAEVDIALIKIEATGLTTAVFGDSDTVEVGDKSVVIGNPLGTLGGSVTEGIVSALDRSIVIDGKTMHLMQTDAAINPGNSGGGVFNGQGELIGIVVAKSGSSEIDNIGFVIPINDVLNILGDLKQYGYVRGRADTGMSFVDISNQMYAWYYYGSSSTGVFISSVDRGSNAAEAGFQSGDRVISVDGKKVSSASDITAIIAEHSSGDTITFELERNSRTGSIDLTLEEYVPGSKSADTDSDSGFGRSPFGEY